MEEAQVAVHLLGHPNIIGLHLPDGPSCLPVLSLYADDTSVIASSNNAIRAVFCVYDKFERCTGAKLNMASAHVSRTVYALFLSMMFARI